MSTAIFQKIRRPVVAGRFYPSEAVELRRLIDFLLAGAPQRTGPMPKAIVVPHAGYIYSGPVAASAYAQFLPASDTIKRIVLLGPSHYFELDGLALPSAEALETPLGLVPVDVEAVRRLQTLPQVTVLDQAHAREHSLEVQLPFLQVVLKQFTVVPLAVGYAEPQAISAVLEALWNGPETRLVISSDLSHYHDWATARHLDEATAKAIEALQPDALENDQMCGIYPVRGLLQAARHHKLHAHTLDLRNSGDTAGPRERVVGYGAFAFEGN
jgi:MEMO1 family protein